jgi:hypothetical protein
MIEDCSSWRHWQIAKDGGPEAVMVLYGLGLAWSSKHTAQGFINR